MKRVAFYIRVSTSKQDTENQRRELEAVADRSGWKIVKVYEDAGISGAKGRDQRPALDAMMKAVNAKEFDMVATLSVDRLGRSLTDLLGILQGLHEKGVGLFLHQQGLDTSTTAGKAMFEMLGVFAEFERGTIRERGNAGLARARANGTKPGLRRIEPKVEAKILELGANMAPYRIFDPDLQSWRRSFAAIVTKVDAAQGLYCEPRGRIGITAPVLFGRLFINDLLVEFLRRFPGTEVSTLFVDRIVHLPDEDYDIAVRIGPLPDSSLRAIRVGTVRRVICGALAYLEARGVPHTPDDLTAHDVIGVTNLDSGLDWKFSGPRGPYVRRVSPRLFANVDDTGIAAAEAAFGLTQVYSYKVAPQLRDGRLKIVLGAHAPPPVPVHVIHQEGNRASARVRALVDYLVDRLRTNSAINECCDRQPKKSATTRLKSPDPPGRANYRTAPVG